MAENDKLAFHSSSDPITTLVCGFEQLLRSEQDPSIDDIVARVPPAERLQLTQELLRVQVQVSREFGWTCDPASLCERYPENTAFIRQLFKTGASHQALFDTVPPRTLHTSTHYCYRANQYAGGGQGTLYKGTDEELGGREMIIKFLRTEFRADDRIREQFEREAEVTAKLDHPGIVPVYTKGTDAETERPFYTMRLIHGSPLDELIRNYHAGNRQHGELVTLIEHLIAACNTVAYAHNVGLLHCDLKPKNIMSGRFGATIVVDWGLARESSATAPELSDTAKRLHIRRQGTSDGYTIPYASPEQLQGNQALHPTSDVYSLGATLYEILTGQPPFDVRDSGVHDLVVGGRFRHPRQVLSGIPKRLEAICLQAMRLEPGQRYSAASDMAHDLQRWLRDEEVSAAPDNFLERCFRLARRHRSAATFIAAVATIVVVASIAVRMYQLESRDLSASFDAALDVIERFTIPLANDETGELQQFKPLAEDVRRFAAGYLDDFGNRATPQRLARVNELRGAVEYYNFTTGKKRNQVGKESGVSASRESALGYYQTALQSYDATRPADLLLLARNELTQGRWLSQIAAASLLEDKPELQVAVTALQRSIQHMDAYSKLATPSPEQQRLKQRLKAEAHHLLGEAFLQRTDRYTESRQHFLQSIAIRETLTDDNNDPSALRDLARGYGYLGDVEVRLDQLGDAQASYQKSLEYRYLLFSKDESNNEHAFQYGRGLTNFGRLALGYGTTCADLAEKLQQACSVQRQLAQEGDQRFIRDFVSTLTLTAELGLLGVIDLNNESVQRVLTEADEWLQRIDDSGSTSTHALCNVLFALVEQEQQNQDRSRDRAREAIKVLTNSDKYGYEHLDRNSVVVFALAKALLGENDAARGALERAVELGNNQYFRIQRQLSCGGLKSLSSEPVVRALLDSMRKAHVHDKGGANRSRELGTTTKTDHE